ncbi:MAG: replication-relaxation family protein [Myxococcaceae bacterium]|nr:replication-relaxation family protein [Myxococcaceae bacterium]
MTERDRHACAVVREGRTLSGEQLKRLMTPGRQDSASRWFVRSLVELGLLRRTDWVGRDGVVAAYSVTANGDYEAERVAPGGVSAEPVDVASMAHHLELTELYVRLLELSLPKGGAEKRRSGRGQSLEEVYVRASHPSWRWLVAGEGVSLPWKEYTKGALRERLIRPDAVLELPRARRRLFIEEETGSHTIRAVSPDKPGATVEKVKRYVAYVTGFVDANARTTWYQSRHPDGWRPELVLMEPSEARCAAVKAAVAPLVRPPLVVHVWTVAQAVAAVAPDAGVSPPAVEAGVVDAPTGKHDAPAGRVLTPAEAEALKRFFLSARSDLKARQADAGGALKGLLARRPVIQGTPEEAAKAVGAAKSLYERLRTPTVPEAYDEVKALVARLGAVLS